MDSRASSESWGSATTRIVTYLNTGLGVPINVVFADYFPEDGREHLARTWLLDEAAAPARTGTPRGGVHDQWNRKDWYVSFGEESGVRSWDARRYGSVSAGGGGWALSIGRQLRRNTSGG
jgi:hypothetical protein